MKYLFLLLFTSSLYGGVYPYMGVTEFLCSPNLHFSSLGDDSGYMGYSYGLKAGVTVMTFNLSMVLEEHHVYQDAQAGKRRIERFWGPMTRFFFLNHLFIDLSYLFLAASQYKNHHFDSNYKGQALFAGFGLQSGTFDEDGFFNARLEFPLSSQVKQTGGKAAAFMSLRIVLGAGWQFPL